MTTTTALGGLPVPSDTDPVSDGALAMRNLAAALDRKIIRKAADEAVASSTVVQDDNELLFPVAANKNYAFDITVICSCASAAVDIKFGMTAPAGATLTWSVISLDPAAASWLGQANFLSTNTAGATIPAGVHAFLTPVLIRGNVAVGATPGNVQLQWSQNSSSASAMTVKAGSHLIAEVI